MLQSLTKPFENRLHKCLVKLKTFPYIECSIVLHTTYITDNHITGQQRASFHACKDTEAYKYCCTNHHFKIEHNQISNLHSDSLWLKFNSVCVILLECHFYFLNMNI